MKSIYKRFSVVGSGGINCRCCCNRGGKPLAKRLAKRKLEKAVKKLIKEVLELRSIQSKGYQSESERLLLIRY